MYFHGHWASGNAPQCKHNHRKRAAGAISKLSLVIWESLWERVSKIVEKCNYWGYLWKGGKEGGFVSLTSIPRKIQEQIIKQTICKPLGDNKKMSDSQHGFVSMVGWPWLDAGAHQTSLSTPPSSAGYKGEEGIRWKKTLHGSR